MSMGCEVLCHLDQEGLRWTLSEIESRLTQEARKWAFVEVKKPGKEQSHLYVPAFSRTLREACSKAKIFWVECSEKNAPWVVLKLLESSLCAGVLLRGLDEFSKNQPASIWGRRWQLASKKSGTELFWLHEKMQAVLGFDQRLSWLSGGCEILRGREDVFKTSVRRRKFEKDYQPAA